MKETLKQHFHFLQVQSLIFSQFAAVDLIYNINEKLMYIISKKGYEDSVNITEPQCQLLISSTTAFYV